MRPPRTATLLPALLLLPSTPAPASPLGIAATTGDFQVVTAPPSVQREAYQSSTALRIFPEREIPAFPGQVPINALAPGVYHAYSDFTDTSITPPGPFRSYFIHFDPVGTSLVQLNGSVTFDNPIIGVIARSLTMQQTDPTLGSPVTLYPTNCFDRELEYQGRGNYDYFQLLPDQHTIYVRAECSAEIDQIRVLVAVPEPATPLTACALALLPLTRRRPRVGLR